ncbi:MAG: NFACT RNA binding domain-containing protein [Clostridia bacterium]
MAFDGIVTKSITKELKNIIGYKIDKVYEPDKNTVTLGLYGKSSNLMLLICISSNNCRISLTSHPQKNPSTAPNFCMLLRKYLIGLKIKNIYTIDLERIVFIDLENNENPNNPICRKLIIELMGKHSNIILTDSNNIIIDSMRHTSTLENSNRDIYPTARYIFPESTKYSFLELNTFDDFYNAIEPKLIEYIAENSLNIENLNVSNFMIDKMISNTFNGISLSFIQNILSKLNIKEISKNNFELIYNKINEILSSSFLDIFLAENQKDYYLYTSNIENESQFNLNYKIDDFYFEKETSELFKNYRNSILHLILATLKKYEKRLENIDNKLSECNNMDKFRLYGELITSNLYRIPNRNVNSIEVENYYDNNSPITIPLDQKYLPSYNAKRYFKKYNKLKNALAIVNVQKDETIRDIDYIESVIYELDNAKSIDNLEAIYDEISENGLFSDKLKVKSSSKKASNKKAKPMTKNKLTSFNPLKYVIDGYTVLVGRNNKENDYLTCKFANKNDIWFHTKDIHGSHVILKTNPNEIVPDDVLFEVAKLAAKHSKAKNSSHIPVDFCKVSFVKKPSGSKPGYVIYSNNKTLYV